MLIWQRALPVGLCEENKRIRAQQERDFNHFVELLWVPV